MRSLLYSFCLIVYLAGCEGKGGQQQEYSRLPARSVITPSTGSAKNLGPKGLPGQDRRMFGRNARRNLQMEMGMGMDDDDEEDEADEDETDSLSPSSSAAPSVSTVPTLGPTAAGSALPSSSQSQVPSSAPSLETSFIPSWSPSIASSDGPSSPPTGTQQPSFQQSGAPIEPPSVHPSEIPSTVPSPILSEKPVAAKSAMPSPEPTSSAAPSFLASGSPSFIPSAHPSIGQSIAPTGSAKPSAQQSTNPSSTPSVQPSLVRSSIMSSAPSVSYDSTNRPSLKPNNSSIFSSTSPTAFGSVSPSASPLEVVTLQPFTVSFEVDSESEVDEALIQQVREALLLTMKDYIFNSLSQSFTTLREVTISLQEEQDDEGSRRRLQSNTATFGSNAVFWGTAPDRETVVSQQANALGDTDAVQSAINGNPDLTGLVTVNAIEVAGGDVGDGTSAVRNGDNNNNDDDDNFTSTYIALAATGGGFLFVMVVLVSSLRRRRSGLRDVDGFESPRHSDQRELEETKDDRDGQNTSEIEIKFANDRSQASQQASMDVPDDEGNGSPNP